MAEPTTRVPVNVRSEERKGMVVTDDAAAKVRQLLDAEGDPSLVGLRVAVRPGGCSGFSYEMYFDSEVVTDDVVTEHSGVKVLVDPASLPHLAGAVLDFNDGLMDAGFTIENPNAGHSCGCGKSFS